MGKWFERAIPLFAAVKFDGTTLISREFFEAAVYCSKIYEFVWGGGIICRQLEKDLRGSAGACLEATKAHPVIFPNVKSCPSGKVSDVPGFKRGVDVRDKMLWCTRALKFIVSILTKLVSDPALEVHVAARATYNEILAPHHAWPVRQIARPALSQCPWRRDMLAKLVMTNQEFVESAQELLGIMTPMVIHVHNLLMGWQLEKAQWDVRGVLALIADRRTAQAASGSAPSNQGGGAGKETGDAEQQPQEQDEQQQQEQQPVEPVVASAPESIATTATTASPTMVK